MDDEPLKKGEGAALLTTVVTVLLALAKYVAGILSGNLILITDALHSAADVFPIFASWFGLKISQRDPDEKFPYGYYKAESIATLLVSLFIMYAAVEFLRDGYARLFFISDVSHTLTAMAVASSSIVISLLIARYQKRVGEETNSQSLLVNSKESLIDVLSSFVVLVGVVLTYYRIPYVEGVVSIAIAVLILRIGIESVRDSIYALMDKSPSEDIEKEVIAIIGSIAGVEGFQDLKLRRSGPFIFGEATVMIRKFVDVDRAHEIADKMETELKEEIDGLDYFVTHVEPYQTAKHRIAVPIKDDEGLQSDTSDHFGRAPYYALVSADKSDRSIEDLETLDNEYNDKDVRAGLNAANMLVEEKIDYLFTKEIGEISFHTMRDHLVDIYKVGDETVKESVERFLDDDIELLESPTREKD